MREQEYRARDKKVNRMTRDGLVQDNLSTGDREKISKREADADFRHSVDEQSFERKSIRSELAGNKQGEPHRRLGMKPEEYRVGEVKTEPSINEELAGNEQMGESVERAEPIEQNRLNPIRETHIPSSKSKKNSYRHTLHKKQVVTEGKLQFTKEESEKAASFDSTGKSGLEGKLEKLEEKSEKAVSKLETARKRQATSHSVKVKRVLSEEKGKAGYKLYFEDGVKRISKDNVLRRTTGRTAAVAANAVHNKVSQNQDDNAGVEATNKSLQTGEAALRMNGNRRVNKQRKQQSRINRLENKVYRTNTNVQYQKYLAEHPEMKKKILNKFYQKQRIKREYRKAYKAGRSGGSAVKKSAQVTTKVAKKLVELLGKNKVVLLTVGVIGILLLFIMAGFSSCSAMFSNTVSTVVLSSYLSEPTEIDNADLVFSNMEVLLQEEVNRVESDYPGYDEYRYQLGTIAHDPFTLISYLSAKFETFDAAMVSAELDSLFQEMYTFTVTEEIEKRTRQEERTYTNPRTGVTTTYTVDVEYDYYILNVVLEVKPLEEIASARLNDEQKELYDGYDDTKGGLQQLGSPFSYNWYSNISSHYGYRVHPITGQTKLHRGIDIAAPAGTPVLTVHSGTVKTVTYDSGYGNYIVIEDEDGYVTKYAHLSSTNVTVGQTVEAGDTIGGVGTTGSSTGNHLHLEVLKDGEYYNPLFYISTGIT